MVTIFELSDLIFARFKTLSSIGYRLSTLKLVQNQIFLRLWKTDKCFHFLSTAWIMKWVKLRLSVQILNILWLLLILSLSFKLGRINARTKKSLQITKIKMLSWKVFPFHPATSLWLNIHCFLLTSIKTCLKILTEQYLQAYFVRVLCRLQDL